VGAADIGGEMAGRMLARKPQTAAQSHGSKPSCGAEARSIPAHNQAGWKARKHPAGEKYFLLNLPFI
jgi:hypothetical protein